MSDHTRLPIRGTTTNTTTTNSSPAPPPPPPPAPVHQNHRYSNRAASALARFAQPFFSGSRPPSPQTPGSRADSSGGPHLSKSKSLPGASQTVTHKTGIPIAALDINSQRTHAVIGGKEILKTVHVSPDHLSEEFNLRNAIISYSSTHHGGSALSARHKDQLTVSDVKWSHGHYDQIIATAVANGRIILYDLHRPGLEFCRFQGHSRQVHRLAFNPSRPYWLLSGSQDSSIRLWDLRATSIDRGVSAFGSKEHYIGNSDAIRDVRWSPIDQFGFATATDSGAIQLWDYRKNNAPLLRITAHDRPCFSVDWHPDGKHIISGGMDRQVKIWDFSSSAERRQKPTFQFRCPQAVLNVRWRPPSWAREPEGSGDWQSTQVVTSYDKEDPRIHLWDLRRPHIPFREFDRFETPANDLLWHSKDLLWTAGDSGALTQTDVRYAPQVVNQRPTCSVAWSPSGEVLAFVQKRSTRNTFGLSIKEFVGHSEEDDSSGEVLSQSPVEELLDEPSFTSIRHRYSKSHGARPSKSLGSTPPGGADFIPVLSLEKTLSKATPPGPRQLGVIGSIPGATMNRETFQYLARKYSPLLKGLKDIQLDPLRALLESLSHNAKCADDVSLVKLAQTWQIIKYSVTQELQLKAREQQHRPPEKGSLGPKKKPSKEGLGVEKPRVLEEGNYDKFKNRLFKGVVETETPKKPLTDSESASNMTTPLAKPLPDSPIASDSANSHMTSLNDPTDIQPLPPSVLSSHQDTMKSNEWPSMSDVDDRPAEQLQRRGSNASESPLSGLPHASAPQDYKNDQRSAPRAITGKTDWHALSHQKEGADDEYDQKMEDKRAAIRDYKSVPKKVLTLESPMDSPKQREFHRHESSESFPMFSASTESSHPSKSVGTSFSSALRLDGVSESGDNGENAISDAVADNPSPSDRKASELTTDSAQNEDVQIDEEFEESNSDPGHIHLERPSSPPTLLKESSPLPVAKREGDIQAVSNTTEVDWGSTKTETANGLPRVAIPISSDGANNKPWSAEVLLKEAIKYYHSSTNVDIQSAAHLLQKLHELYQNCEEIVTPKESAFIFQAYHEQLQRQSMYTEAAELRLLCVPSYPEVYEYAQADTSMNVFCYTCKRPYENPKPDNYRCHRCSTPQDPCSICMSVEPPPEWVAEQSLSPVYLEPEPDSETTSHLPSSTRSSIKTAPFQPSEIERIEETCLDTYVPPRPKGSTLWTWCQGCGHGGHMACISVWLKDTSVSEGGCATPGCMHDCGPGPRREQNRHVLLEESKRRDSVSRKSGLSFAKRDTWAKGESKAVEKVRGMLGSGISGATSSSNNSGVGPSAGSSNLMSPKKVRLITPSEQGKRRARASIGGNSTVST